jgi:hypothetical protein
MSKKTIILTLFLAVLLAGGLSSVIQTVSYAQFAQNPQGTLYGENLGDSIVLRWDIADNAAEYIVWRSTSLNGPWQVNGRFPQSAVKTGGATVEYTDDARLMDLCYKVEALDTAGVVIELYEPICVPKFDPNFK